MIKTENLTILFVDIAGFTATTSRQSRVENARLLQTFGSTLLPLIKSYKGRLIKTIGDALLITFRSPTDAMLCSMALQDAMHAHNLSASEGEKIHIRVAANLGEVRVTKNDIFGEPVNVASRIEGVAPADEIYLSEAVYMAMNKAEVPAREVGTKELAGVAHPVRLYNIPRFSTHRLVAESSNAEEQGSELLYPYGGMHFQSRPRSISSLMHIQDGKRLTRLLVFGASACVIALGAAMAYQHFFRAVSTSPVISQSVEDESLSRRTRETEQPVIAEEPVSREPEEAAVSHEPGIVPEDVSEKEAPKVASLPAKTSKTTTGKLETETATEKTTAGTRAPAPETVKEKTTTGTWEPETAKEKTTTGTWAPSPETITEKTATGTWTPEPETATEKTTTGTWTPEPEIIQEKTTGGTQATLANIVSTPAKESISETIEADIEETESVESKKETGDVISKPLTYAAQVDTTEWDLNKAKVAFNESKITKVEYNRIVSKLKTEYNKTIRQLKLDLDRGKITRTEYDEAVRKAKVDLNGR